MSEKVKGGPRIDDWMGKNAEVINPEPALFFIQLRFELFFHFSKKIFFLLFLLRLKAFHFLGEGFAVVLKFFQLIFKFTVSLSPGDVLYFQVVSHEQPGAVRPIHSLDDLQLLQFATDKISLFDGKIERPAQIVNGRGTGM